MDKQSIIEEFRAIVYRKIEQNEVLEEKIIKIITEKFDKMKKILEQNGVNSDIIDEYLDGNLSMVKVQSRVLCDGRKEDILKQVDDIVKRIQTQLEEETEQKESEEQRRIEQKNIDDFSLIETDNMLYAKRIADEISYNLADIRSHTGRVLDYRKFDLSKIEDIIEDMRVYINKVEGESEEEIYGVLEDDKRDSLEDIINEYREAVEEMQKIDKKDKDQSEEEKFRKSLDAGISLEEQNEFAVQWADVDENEKENEEKRPALESDIELI